MYSVNGAADHRTVRRASVRVVNARSVRLPVADRAFDPAAQPEAQRVYWRRRGDSILDRVAGLYRSGESRRPCATDTFERAAAPAERVSVLAHGRGRGTRNDSSQEANLEFVRNG